MTHAFAVVGARAVRLRVTDNTGAWSDVIKVIPVQSAPPTAAFDFAPANPNTGEVVAFDASGSADADGTIILYEWDISNDGITDKTGMAITHSWPNPGVYPVTLKVTDNDGRIDVATQGVPVQVGGTGGANQPPVADFDFDPADPPDVNLREVVNFNATGCSDPDGVIVAYEWDFSNDGVFDATGPDVAHIFHAGGAQIVTLRVTDDDGLPGFKTRVVPVEFVRPVADFTFTPTNPRSGDVITFNGGTSADPDGRIDFYEWDYNNDGVTDATGFSASHKFNTGGGKPVTLTVTDDDGVTDFITKTVPVVANTAPIADFVYGPAAPTTADTVTFSDRSTDFDGTIAAWLWEFGNGVTSTVQSASYKYATAGTYAVTLKVTDNHGLIGTVTKDVLVGVATNAPPVANFNWAPTLPQANQAVQFNNLSTDTDGTVTGHNWDFGDGTPSTAKNPAHTYAAAGTYAAKLTVTDNDGATSTTVTKQITVSEAVNGLATHSIPNPAKTQSRIVYSLPVGATNVILRIFTIFGRLVFEQNLTATATEYVWNLTDNAGTPLGNGMFAYVITATDAAGAAVKTEIHKLLIVR